MEKMEIDRYIGRSIYLDDIWTFIKISRYQLSVVQYQPGIVSDNLSELGQFWFFLAQSGLCSCRLKQQLLYKVTKCYIWLLTKYSIFIVFIFSPKCTSQIMFLNKNPFYNLKAPHKGQNLINLYIIYIFYIRYISNIYHSKLTCFWPRKKTAVNIGHWPIKTQKTGIGPRTTYISQPLEKSLSKM